MLVALPGKLVHKHLNMHFELREERARVVAPDTHLHELFEEAIQLTAIHLFPVFAIIGYSINRQLSEAIGGKVEQPLAQQLVYIASENIRF